MTATAPSAFTPIGERLRRIAPQAANLARVAFDARFERLLRDLLGDESLTIVRRAVPAGARVLELACREGRLQVAVEAGAHPALALALSLSEDADACAVVDLMLAPVRERLSPWLADLRVTRRSSRPVAATSNAPAVTLADVSIALLALDDPLAAHLASAAAGVPTTAFRMAPDFRLAGRLRLLCRDFSLDVIRSLAPGDVVLLDPPPVGSLAAFHLFYGWGSHAMQFSSTLDPQTGQPVVQGESRASAPDGPLAGAPSLDALQVPVSFEVDTARITLGELASIRPGFVIELEHPLSAASVRLVAHGQTIGHGQLVAIGDQLGVRIVRMSLATGDAK